MVQKLYSVACSVDVLTKSDQASEKKRVLGSSSFSFKFCSSKVVFVLTLYQRFPKRACWFLRIFGCNRDVTWMYAR